MRKYLKFILLFLFAVFIFWFFGRNLDWREVSVSLRKADPFYLGLALLGICFGYFIRSVRWQVLLRPITASRLSALFATTTVGFAAMFLVGRAGEIVRPMWLPMLDWRVRPGAALVTVFVERVFDLASLICFFSISLIWFKAPAGHESEFASVKLAGNVLLAATLLGVVSLIVYHFRSAAIIGWFERITDRKFVPARIRSVFLSLLKQLATSLEILKSPWEIFLASFWTLVLWLSIAVPTWFVLLAFGLPMSFFDSTFVMGVASLGSLVPTPGGAAGAFHAATAGSLILLSVDREIAAAVSIVMHLVYFAPAVFFGLYYLFHGDISIEKFRSLLSGENAEREIESDSPDFAEESNV
ncbi:MAG: lysylphosphatidylglycerol synthase transmembrane domain-containing protein [Pyrinomonadaceae bacterium]